MCKDGPLADEDVVVGLGTELPVLEDIIEMRLSHDDEGRPLFPPFSCAEGSSVVCEGGFVYVCRRRRSLLLCESTKFGLKSAATGPFSACSSGDLSNSVRL